jgi:hypothetical protein
MTPGNLDSLRQWTAAPSANSSFEQKREEVPLQTSGGFQQDALPLRSPPSRRWFAPGGEGCGRSAASPAPAPLARSRESGGGCSPRRDADLSGAEVRYAARRRCGLQQGRGASSRSRAGGVAPKAEARSAGQGARRGDACDEAELDLVPCSVDRGRIREDGAAADIVEVQGKRRPPRSTRSGFLHAPYSSASCSAPRTLLLK